jgi:hypothetical protein
MRRPRVIRGMTAAILLTCALLVSISQPAGASGIPGSTLRPRANAQSARGTFVHPDIAIRRGHGDFVGSGSFDTDAEYQQIAVAREPGVATTFLIRVRSVGATQSIVLAGPGATPGFDVTYLAGTTGTNDITAEVVAGTRTIVDLPPGHVRYLRLIVTAHPDAAPQRTAWDVTATSASDPTLVDAVRATIVLPAVTTSSLDRTGDLRCTASFPATTVDPGTPTGVLFTVTNESDESVTTYADTGALRFTDGSGHVLGDTLIPYRGGFSFPRTIRPGHTIELYGFDTLVRWPGTLTVIPTCRSFGSRGLRLPPVSLEVSVPAPAPRAAEAVHRAVDATNGLFETCRPDGRGRPVQGIFEVPATGRSDEALSTRCWAKVSEYPGFDIVTLSFITPQDLAPYDVDQDEPEFEFDGIQYLPTHGSSATARWDFVVTADGAHSYGFASQARTNPADRFATSYFFYDDRWTIGGWSRCGYEGYAVGWGIDVFYVDWVNGCPSTRSRSGITAPADADTAWSMPAPGVLTRAT